MSDFNFTITRDFGNLSEVSATGYTKKVTELAWGKAEPKLDIRMWRTIKGQEPQPLKGIGLERAEAKQLHDLLEKYLTDEAPEPNEK